MSIFIEDDQETAWMLDGACRGLDPGLFYSEKGMNKPVNALAVCKSCSVKDQCLAYALKHRETRGVWGGTTPGQRKVMARGMNQRNARRGRRLN